MKIGNFRVRRCVAGSIIAAAAIGTVQAPVASAAPPPRVVMSTWAYDKVAPNTYEADNNGKKGVTIYWESTFAPATKAPYGCFSTISVRLWGVNGPLIHRKSTEMCTYSNPGWRFDAPFVGTYFATVVVRSRVARPVTKTIVFRVVPASPFW